MPTEEEKGGLRAGAGRGRLPPPPGVGDGGASWRMKALKRAQEQAAREGRKLDEVCVLDFCDDEVLNWNLSLTCGGRPAPLVHRWCGNDFIS